MKKSRNTIAALLLVTVMAPGFFAGVLPAREAQAITALEAACFLFGELGIGAATTVGTVASGVLAVPVTETNPAILTSAAVTATQISTLTWKECVLDPILWVFKELIISEITESIIEWIESGFEGTPMFVLEPMKFLKNVALATIDVFLFEMGLEQWLCSPFELDLRIAFYLNSTRPAYGEFGGLSCELDEIFPGASVSAEVAFEDVVEGGTVDFEGGGLWNAMRVAEPGNNAIDGLFTLAAETELRSNMVTASEGKLLDYGDGYYSMRCDADEDGLEDDACTPGEYVSRQIDDWTGGALGQLEVADEISEIITALIVYLVQEILVGGETLAGASDRDSTIDYAYNPDIADQLDPAVDDTVNVDDLIDVIPAPIPDVPDGGGTGFTPPDGDFLLPFETTFFPLNTSDGFGTVSFTSSDPIIVNITRDPTNSTTAGLCSASGTSGSISWEVTPDGLPLLGSGCALVEGTTYYVVVSNPSDAFVDFTLNL